MVIEIGMNADHERTRRRINANIPEMHESGTKRSQGWRWRRYEGGVSADEPWRMCPQTGALGYWTQTNQWRGRNASRERTSNAPERKKADPRIVRLQDAQSKGATRRKRVFMTDQKKITPSRRDAQIAGKQESKARNCDPQKMSHGEMVLVQHNATLIKTPSPVARETSRTR